MKKIVFFIFYLISTNFVSAQEVENSLRVNFFNPGVEWDIPTSNKSILTVNPGIGWNTSYAHDRFLKGDDGLTYFIAPFVDCSLLKVYNLEKRAEKGKKIQYNSGNYYGVRFITKFKHFDVGDNDRAADTDFSIAPVWGIRRSLGKFHYMVEAGPTCYFDTEGNLDIMPIIFRLKLGLNIK